MALSEPPHGATAPKPMFCTVRTSAILIALYFALWWIANSPALLVPWWTSDDYGIGTHFSATHAIQNGRPFALPVYYLLSLESGPYGAAIDLSARLVQGLLHAGSALIVACVLARRSGTRLALLAVALFVVFPYNGEAVLWRSAAMMPVATFVSLLGFLAAERGVVFHRPLLALAGSMLVTASVLIHQQTSFVALLLWCMILVVDHTPDQRSNLLLGVWLGGGFALGAILSMSSTWFLLGGLLPRGGVTLDLATKLPYVIDMTRSFVWDRYSAPVTIIQAALAFLGVFAAAALLADPDTPLFGRFVRAAAFCALVIAPFGPLLLTGESPQSARNFYLAPLLLIGCLLLINEAGRGFRWVGWTLAVAATLLIAFYVPVSRASAQEYVTLYELDVAAIRTAEKIALQQNAGKPVRFVYVNPSEYLRSWDIHGLRPEPFRSNVDKASDAKGSAFIISWAFKPLVEQFTSQSVEPRHEYEVQCARSCNEYAEKTPFRVIPLAGGSVSCICP